MAQNKAFYYFGRTLLFPFYKLLYRFKVKNRDAVPAEGGVILACNHMSFADPVLLGLSQRRRLYFMAKAELFRNKFAGAVIRALGAFPVERGAGDGKALKTGEDILREGNAMTIFLEGTRTKTGELLRPRSGCALVAQQMQLPVVPCCITKRHFHHMFSKTIVHFGAPLTPAQMGLTPEGGRRELKNATNMIMDEIRKMREEDAKELSQG
ncbi:MAG: 1-acyl-sn-glycerol-3-phosphate acyltransferase [Ruminococcus sp.]|nr:1-acyl-sn-glycerol-3-phosphate acyltransferase [Ruminococcus sp.]